MTTLPFILDLVTSIGIGALVGLEREHRRETTDVYAGVRTFPLIALAGYLVAWFTRQLDEPLVLAAGILVAGLAAMAFFWGRYRVGDLGFTTPMAILVTFLAGSLVGFGLRIEAVVVAVATTFLLLTKERLHRLAETLENDEIMGALQFVALAFIALPLARSFPGPYLGGLVGEGRPVDLEWTLYIVVIASGLAFVSFVALRQIGSRHGFTLVGGLGGLVNSTAATAGAASIAKGAHGVDRAASAAVLAATGTALIRNLVLAGVADPSLQLLPPFAMVLALPLLVLAAATLWLSWGLDDGEPAPDFGLRSPFAIRPALLFALVFTAVNAFVFYAQDLLGVWGIYATSIGALISSGAVVASAANLAFTGTVPIEVAVTLAGLAVVLSVLEKIGVLAVTNRDLIPRTAGPILLVAGATAAGLLFLV